MTEQPTPLNVRCPVCGRGDLFLHQVDESFDFDLGEESIRVHASGVPVERCDQCGEELSGPAAAKVRHEAVCRTAGLFTPEEIKALRERLGLSQEELARLVGVGVATVSRWEKGRLIQNQGNDQLLFLLSESEEARRLLHDRVAVRTLRKETNEIVQDSCSGKNGVMTGNRSELD